jgi:recombinational DNA repair protein (RecF pathway)
MNKIVAWLLFNVLRYNGIGENTYACPDCGKITNTVYYVFKGKTFGFSATYPINKSLYDALDSLWHAYVHKHAKHTEYSIDD